MPTNRYDELIREAVERHFPDLLKDFGSDGWRWIRAQIRQESAFKTNAKSPVGAMGLMQIMPDTWKWLGGGDNPFDPEQNIEVGVRFMAYLYGRFGEIPDPEERMRVALASYNGGPGYPSVALALAREADGLPYGFGPWKHAGRPDGRWQTWAFWSCFLADPRCRVKSRGRRLSPDHRQMLDYVEKICAYHALYVKQDGGTA
jgi:hypothetical protein